MVGVLLAGQALGAGLLVEIGLAQKIAVGRAGQGLLDIRREVDARIDHGHRHPRAAQRAAIGQHLAVQHIGAHIHRHRVDQVPHVRVGGGAHIRPPVPGGGRAGEGDQAAPAHAHGQVAGGIHAGRLGHFVGQLGGVHRPPIRRQDHQVAAFTAQDQIAMFIDDRGGPHRPLEAVAPALGAAGGIDGKQGARIGGDEDTPPILR